MKKVLIAVLCIGFLASCDSKSSKRILTDSSGRINNVKVVVDKEQWQGFIGDALRKVLAAPVYGLPREEPLFSIDQIPPEAFSGFLRKNRIFIKLAKGEAGITIEKDIYAAPQTGITITGNTEQEIAETILKNGKEIVQAFKEQELIENQRRIKLSLKKVDSLKESFGVSLRFPTAYRYASENKEFFWMRKDLKRSGNMNITVYEVPLKTLDRDTFTIARIVRMRDSIAGKNIPVDDGRFQTERAFAPFLQKTEIDGRFAWETKGTWDVEGRYMAGPFLNYAIRDERNDRYLVLEGFIFSPSQDQRDNMFELEAILRSAKLK
jgi:hypothetical protein